MSFQRSLKIPKERIAVIIGKNGKIKEEIEKKCNVILDINSKTGEALVSSKIDTLHEMLPFVAIELISAIGKGFSPERAYRLTEENNSFLALDLRDYVGKSSRSVERIKGRVIGEKGKSRKTIEQLTGAYISVYGNHVGFIGLFNQIRLARSAVMMLTKGSSHRSVFDMLQGKRKKAKLDRMLLWEGDDQKSISSESRLSNLHLDT
jgi:ribosomal RNA assembly protein